MGLFDFLFNRKKIKTTEIHSATTLPTKVPVVAPTVQNPVSKPESKKKASVKVSNHDEIEKNIQIESESDNVMLEVYCAVLPARIFCHSILIDKLGDLTKFIITSLYAGHSIEEIADLTHMGSTTIKEEIEYLIRGDLVKDDMKSLTELGLQYGKLFEIFDKLSEGIGMAFNTFANIFEPIEENGYCSEADPEFILPNNYIPILARNDNYANSLDIATEQIEESTPFSWEIKNSLYATVKIEKFKPGYKKMVIKDFSTGLREKTEKDACVKVAIPCDHIFYKPRYSWIDPYRMTISRIKELNDNYNDLITEKAKLIVKASQEEKEAEEIIVDIDMVLGGLNNSKEKLEELPVGDNIFILNRKNITISLGSESCEELYLEEVNREHLYKIRYFPYSQMEVQ